MALNRMDSYSSLDVHLLKRTRKRPKEERSCRLEEGESNGHLKRKFLVRGHRERF